MQYVVVPLVAWLCWLRIVVFVDDSALAREHTKVLGGVGKAHSRHQTHHQRGEPCDEAAHNDDRANALAAFPPHPLPWYGMV